MTPEEIAGLLEMQAAADKPHAWNAQDHLKEALFDYAPDLLRAAKIAARVPEGCCLTCLYFDEQEGPDGMDCSERFQCDCDDWEAMP